MLIQNSMLQCLVKTSYTLKDLAKIGEFFEHHDTLRFLVKENGLYSAITTDKIQSISGYTYTWLRDAIMVTNYQRELGHYDIARKTITTLGDYFHRHRSRFIDIIEGDADKDDPMQRPHIRFDGDSLDEINQKWAHAENDALGYFLWMAFKLANMKERALTPVDYDVYSLFPNYFYAIEYWQDEDSGHWEEARKIESSSIGVVVAALEEMKAYIEWHPHRHRFSYNGTETTAEFLQYLIDKGRETLNSFLPYESPNLREADAALLFLIYPLAVIDNLQSDEVLSLVLKNLQGDYGIKRYLGDSYWCADYKKQLLEEERTVDFSDDIGRRDKLLRPNCEAQWCIFDPVVSVIFGQRHLKTGEKADLDQQTHYFNRSLCQITSESCPLGSGKCPEAYYIENLAEGKYVPNDHAPLAWTQANLGIAFEYMKRSANKE